MKISINRMVIYTSLDSTDGKYPPEQNAAVVTRVRDEQKQTCAIKIFYPTGIFDMDNVPFSEEYAKGCWSWPKRVEG